MLARDKGNFHTPGENRTRDPASVAFLLANLNPDFAIEKSIFFFCFFVFGLNQSKIAIRTIYL